MDPGSITSIVAVSITCLGAVGTGVWFISKLSATIENLTDSITRMSSTIESLDTAVTKLDGDRREHDLRISALEGRRRAN